jgi:hypothetical protein
MNDSADATVEVDVQNPLERRLVRLPHRPVRHDAGVGDHEVDAAHDLGGLVDRRP